MAERPALDQQQSTSRYAHTLQTESCKAIQLIIVMMSSGEIRMPERYYGSEIAEFLVPGDMFC